MKKKFRYYLRDVVPVLRPYLITAVMLIGLFAVGIVVGNGVLRENAMRDAEELITRLSDSLVSDLDRHERICDILAASVEVSTLAAADTGEIGEMSGQIAYLRRDIENITQVSGTAFSGLAVYFPASHTLVTREDVTQQAEETGHLALMPFDAGPLLGQLREVTDNRYWHVFYSDGNRIVARTVLTGSGSRAYVLLWTDLGILMPVERDNGIALIGDGVSCTWAVGEGLSGEDYAKVRELIRQHRRIEYKGRKYLGSLVVMSSLHREVLFGFPLDTAAGGRAFRISMACLGGLCLAILLVTFFLLYRQVLVPMRFLAETADRSGGTADAGDVFDRVRSNLVRLQSRNEETQSDLGYLTPLGVGELLRRLCTCSEESVARFARRTLTLAGIPQDSRYCIVGIFHLEDAQGTFSDMTRHNQNVTPMFVLKNILGDLVFDRRRGTVAAVDHYYILLAECLEGEGETEIQEILDWMLEFYQENYGVTIAATRPLIIEGLSPLREATRRTIDSLHYLEFWHNDSLDSGSPGTEQGSLSYARAMRNFINLLDERDYRGASRLFERMLEENVPTGAENIQATRYRLYGMIDILFAAVSERAGPQEGSIRELEQERRFFQYGVERLDTFRDVSGRLFDMLEQAGDEDPGPVIGNRMEDVYRYIQEHYTDKTLSVTSLAERFHLSVAYLSREFKRVMGIGPLEHIQKLRVELARTLLRHDPVKTVAEKAGFWDAQALNRTFKKYEGVTPREYRRQLGRDDGKDA